MSEVHIYGREILREFINLYRANECLWNTKSENYQHQGARLTAYTILLQKLKEADKNATIFTVKNKINSMRTCYRHELKKIKTSKESGAEGDAIYKPTLWYFHDLAFLIGDKVPDVRVEENNINKLTDLRSCSRTFVKEFINLYKKHECLWNVELEQYKDKIIKAKAYEELRLKCLEIDKSATIDLVKKKINSMRTIFLANYKKMEKSKLSSDPDDFFQPKLFYFDDLKFLLNKNSEISFEDINTSRSELSEEDEKMNNESIEENNRRSRSCSSEENNKRSRSESLEENNIKSRSESPAEYKLFENVKYDEVDDYFIQSQKYNQQKSKYKNNIKERKRIRSYSDYEDENEDILLENVAAINSTRKPIKPTSKILKYRDTIQYEENKEDEFQIYAKYLASEMRTLSTEDLIFVKKLFNDTLFEAKLGNAKCMRIMSRAKLHISDNKIN